MGATTNVNGLTVVHAKSGGMAMSFPDVCKTPFVGPVPYPNVARSADTSRGSPTVTVDGKPIMLKSSCFSTSSGDDPGMLKGVVSNQVKGKALPAHWSFDVKVDGENVFRLSDPMKTNAGSPANTLCAAEAQAALGTDAAEGPECKQAKKRKREHDQRRSNWDNSGIIEEHRKHIANVATEFRLVLYFRRTKGECAEWIRGKHQPKPHTVAHATTIVHKVGEDPVALVQEWLDAHFSVRNAAWVDRSELIAGQTDYHSRDAETYIGIVGVSKGKGIQPMRAKDPLLLAKGKWITGDYDLFQVLQHGADCEELDQGSPCFRKLKEEINTRLGWAAIQHGPQAQWASAQEDPQERDKYHEFDMSHEVKMALRTRDFTRKVQAIKARPEGMSVIDAPLTVVAGHGAILRCDDQTEAAEALLCKGCGT